MEHHGLVDEWIAVWSHDTHQSSCSYCIDCPSAIESHL